MEYDALSFKTGLAIAALSKGQLPKSEPIGYLYGHVAKEGETPTHYVGGVGYVGAVLPKLPEWDTDKFPNACIFEIYPFLYRLFVTDMPVYCEGNEAYSPAGSTLLRYDFSTTTMEDWEFKHEKFYEIRTPLQDIISTTPIWANYRLMKDNSVYLTESEPVPVYE